MLLFVFCFFSKRNIYYDPLPHVDYLSNEFICLHSSERIPNYKYNDGICDCCDGSDEYENSESHCNNTCEVEISKFNEEIVEAFKDSVEKSAKSRIKAADILNETQRLWNKAKSDIYYWENQYQSAKMQKTFYNLKLENITNTILNITVEEEVQNVLDTLMKLLTTAFGNKTSKINETSSFKFLTDNKEEIKPKKNETTVDENIKNALIKAYEDKNFTYIEEIGKYLSMKEKASALANSTYSNYLESVLLKNKMEYLANEDVGVNDEWRQYMTGVIKWNLPHDGAMITLQNMRTLYYSKFGYNDIYSNLIKVGDSFVFVNEKGKKIILKPVCFPDLVVLGHYNVNHMSQVLVFGTPVVCPTSFSNENMMEFFRNVQFYL